MRELLTKKMAAQAVGVHPESLMRLAREGRFPAPVKMGEAPGSAVRFVAEEIEAWLEKRMAARREF